MRKWIVGCMVCLVVGALPAAQGAILGPWEDTGDALPTPIQDSASVVLDGKLYVIGGSDLFLIEQGVVQVYDPSQPAGSRWSTAASLNTPRFKHGAAVLDGKIYVFGGDDGFGPIDSLEVYDPGADTWTVLSPSGRARTNAGVAAANGLIWVIGGERPAGEEGEEDGGGVSRIVQVYDPQTDTWDEATELPYGIEPNYDNYGAQMTAYSYSRGGVEWVGYSCGIGWNSQVNTSGRIDASSITNEWVGIPGPGARSAHAGVVACDGVGQPTMWVLGGELGGFLKDNVAYYGEDEGGQWVDDRPLPEPLSGRPAAGVIGDYLYVTAGLDAEGFLNETTYRAQIVGPFEILSIDRVSDEEVELTFTTSMLEVTAYKDLAADLYTFLAGLEGARVLFADMLADPTTWQTNENSDVTVVDVITQWQDMSDGAKRFYKVERADPPSTGVMVEWAGVIPASDDRFDFSDLPYQPVADDLLQQPGVTVSVAAGGFHPAAGSLAMDDIASLADAPETGNSSAILPRDFAYDQPAVVAQFDLPAPEDIAEIRVFSNWESGRVFQTYDLEVETSGGGDPVVIADKVRSGPWGQSFGGNAKAYYTRVYREDGTPLASSVVVLRVKIYDVSNIAAPENVYLEPAQAFQSPIIHEVDAFPPPQ